MKRKQKMSESAKGRIQRSIVGYRIPMMSIPKLYGDLETAVTAGKSDGDLKAIVAAFPGVEVSK